MGEAKKGTVKWFDRKKGYGFIRMDDGEEVFVHATGIDQGHEVTMKHLKAGESVTCSIDSKDGRLMCVGVCVTDE